MPSLFETEPKFNIEAAKADPAMRLHTQALRRAGVEITKRMTISELDLPIYPAANSNAGHHTIRGYFSRCP